MNSLRVALVAPFALGPKGTARARALPLGRALTALGHKAAIFVPPYDHPAEAGSRCSYGGAEVVTLPVRGSGNAAAALLGPAMARAVRAWRPDVVHVFKPKGPSGLCAALLWGARRAGGPPLVIDADDWEGPGGWNDDQRLRYSAAERLVFAWQERFGLTHADAWTATTRCLAERAAQFGADPARVVVMPNGVPDPSVWERTPPSVPGDHPGRVLLYTRFAGVRPEAVGEVWGRVLAATAESAKPPSLVVAGAPAGADVQGVLRGMPGVAWMGPVAEPDLPGLLTAVAAALVPWEDTNRNRARSSVKVRELMAAGTPVAAYRVGELEGTLGAAGRGRLAAPEDAAALAAIVLGLLRDPAAAGAMGAALRERALSIYRWDRLAGAALEAYGIAGAGR